MPKATLIFNLNDEYERDAHTRALKADNTYRVLRELADHFRSIRKYSELPEDKITTYMEIEDKMYALLNENGVDIFEEYK